MLHSAHHILVKYDYTPYQSLENHVVIKLNLNMRGEKQQLSKTRVSLLVKFIERITIAFTVKTAISCTNLRVSGTCVIRHRLMKNSRASRVATTEFGHLKK